MSLRCWGKRMVSDSGAPSGLRTRQAASHLCSRSTSAPMVSRRWPGSCARPSCAAWRMALGSRT
eukprot:14074755-Alexandrium_andersonii.AAC.1